MRQLDIGGGLSRHFLRGRAQWLLGFAWTMTLSGVIVLSSGPVAIASGWSAPMRVDPSFSPAEVSCASASFCVAVGPDGSFVTYDGGSWNTPTPIAGAEALVSVSCPSPSFCAAIGKEHVFTFDGSSWSAPTWLDTGETWLKSISCSSQAFVR